MGVVDATIGSGLFVHKISLRIKRQMLCLNTWMSIQNYAVKVPIHLFKSALMKEWPCPKWTSMRRYKFSFILRPTEFCFNINNDCTMPIFIDYRTSFHHYNYRRKAATRERLFLAVWLRSPTAALWPSSSRIWLRPTGGFGEARVAKMSSCDLGFVKTKQIWMSAIKTHFLQLVNSQFRSKSIFLTVHSLGNLNLIYKVQPLSDMWIDLGYSNKVGFCPNTYCI